MILRARFVVTMDGPPIENGAVVLNGEFISAVGTFADVQKAHFGEVIDLGEQTILPGLINSHCHLDYTGLRGKIQRQKSFTDWIRAINSAKAGLTQEDYIESINQGFLEARRFGTTSMVNLTAFPDLISFVRPTLRTFWMAELIDVRAPENAIETVNSAIESLGRTSEQGLAPHAPYTASAALYQECQRRGARLTTHLAESREEMSMFRDRSGELYQFIHSINPGFDSGGRTPVAYFLDELNRGADWLIAHLNEVTDDDFERLIKTRPSLQVVHCPRSHRFFDHSPFQFARLKQLFPIVLGTDSMASNDDLNLFAEMRQFQRVFPDVNPEEIVAMITSETSLARVGRFREDFYADVIAIPIDGPPDQLFDQIVAFTGEPWVMVGGQVGTI